MLRKAWISNSRRYIHKHATLAPAITAAPGGAMSKTTNSFSAITYERS